MRGPVFVTRVFDRLHAAYGSIRARKVTSSLLLLTLLAALATIELNQWGWLPSSIAASVPVNHFVAVEWVVELLLLFEVVELIFGLARSVAGAVGKQLEVFSLILLRKSFEELKYFSEPIDLSQIHLLGATDASVLPIWNMSADALGAVAVFGGLVLFNRLQRHRRITDSDEELANFVYGKKAIALLLLALLGYFIVFELYTAVIGGQHSNLFSSLFTALIFSDIAIVFISMRYTSQFSVVFRNFGFTVVTVFVRLAITAPPGLRAVMALGIVSYAAFVSWLYNAAEPPT